MKLLRSLLLLILLASSALAQPSVDDYDITKTGDIRQWDGIAWRGKNYITTSDKLYALDTPVPDAVAVPLENGELYTYDLDGTQTITQSGQVLPGPGGTLSFDGGGTFNGTPGTGRWLRVERKIREAVGILRDDLDITTANNGEVFTIAGNTTKGDSQPVNYIYRSTGRTSVTSPTLINGLGTYNNDSDTYNYIAGPGADDYWERVVKREPQLYADLKAWAEDIITGRPTMPFYSSWETTIQNPKQYREWMEAGRRVVPTFRLHYHFTDSNWDPSASSGDQQEMESLAQHCKENQLPIVIRVGDLEDPVASDDILHLSYEESPLTWSADRTGNQWIADVTPSGTFQAPSADPIRNGTFTTDLSEWDDKSTNTGAIQWDGSAQAKLIGSSSSSAGKMEQSFATVPSIIYTLEFDKTATSGDIRVLVGTSSGGVQLADNRPDTAPQTVSFSFTATTTRTYVRISSYNHVGEVLIDDVTIEGTHHPYNQGDFFVAKAAATLGSTNPLPVSVNDRVVAQSDNPDPDDGDDWSAQSTTLDVCGPAKGYRHLADVWKNTYIGKFAESYPNPPLVVWIHNNEQPYGSFSANTSGYRFNTKYPGLTTTYSLNPPNQHEGYIVEREEEVRSKNTLYTRFKNYSVPDGWRGRVKLIPYTSVGSDGRLRFRSQSGTPNKSGWDRLGTGLYVEPNITNNNHAKYSEYGLEWLFDGGNWEAYWTGSGGQSYIERLQGQDFQRHQYARVLDWVKTKNPDWLHTVSSFPDGGHIDAAMDGGESYFDPDKFGGHIAFHSFLHPTAITFLFLNNNTGLTDEILTPTQRTTHGITDVHTYGDYATASQDKVKALASDRLLTHAIKYWTLDKYATKTDVWEFESEGTYAVPGGGSYSNLLRNSVTDVEVASTQDDTCATLCRSDGNGRGIIFALSPGGAQTNVTVYTERDGIKTVNSSTTGSFWYYTANTAPVEMTLGSNNLTANDMALERAFSAVTASDPNRMVIRDIATMKLTTGRHGESAVILGQYSPGDLNKELTAIYFGVGRSAITTNDKDYFVGPNTDDYWYIKSTLSSRVCNAYVSTSAASNAIIASTYINLLSNADIEDAERTNSEAWTIDDTNDRCTYTSSITGLFKIDISGSFTSTEDGETASFRIAKDGTTLSDTQRDYSTGTGSQAKGFRVTGVTELEATDHIELHGTLSASSSDTITIQNAAIIITPLN